LLTRGVRSDRELAVVPIVVLALALVCCRPVAAPQPSPPGTVYTADVSGNSISIVDAATSSPVATGPAGSGPPRGPDLARWADALGDQCRGRRTDSCSDVVGSI